MRLRKALSVSPILLTALSTACSSGSGDGEVSSEYVGESSDQLTGGRPALDSEYPATVGLGGCTGAKIGPKHYLLAAHCIHDPVNNTVSLSPGSSIGINPNNDATIPGVTSTVASAHIHPQWLATCAANPGNCGVNVLNSDYPPDVAVVIVNDEFPQIPEASIDANTVLTGNSVVMTGYGCENGLDLPSGPPRLKIETVTALAASDLLHPGSYVSTSAQAADVAAQYVITPGLFVNSSAASLCFGDSGGPLNRPGSGEQLVVGINAYYTFAPDSGGVSTTNWHTRVDANDRYDVLPWLQSLGVNVRSSGTCSDGLQNGSESDVDCGGSCPNRCGSGDDCASHSDCSTGFCDSGSGTCQTPPTPCAGLCSNPVQFSTQWYSSGNLGTGATCHETTVNLTSGNCGNFAAGRTFQINGSAVTCNGNPLTLPAKRNGGYCFQASAGNHAWAYFSTW